MMHPVEFIVAANEKLDLRGPRPSRDQRLQDRPRRARLSSRPPADDGAFMEPRGCNWWQSAANRSGARTEKQAKTVAVCCDRLTRMVRSAMKKGLPGDRLRLVDRELSRGGPFRCCTPVWVSAASVSISICLTVRGRPSSSVPRRRMPTAYSG